MALRRVATLKGAVLGVHCENVEVIPWLRQPLLAAGRLDLAAWDEQSPDFLEAENVHRVCYFGRKTGTAVNIVHLSSAEGLAEARRHRYDSPAPIHVETCPHYLHLTSESPAGILAKINPPVRRQADVDALWEGVADGTVATIGSDHVPRKRATKGPDLWSATAGFPSIATMRSIVIEEGYHRREIPIERLAAALGANAARLYNIPRKGTLAVGFDADLVVVDPDLARIVDPAALESFSDYSPYEGETLRGWPVLTMVRGHIVAEDGAITEAARAEPPGRFVSRKPMVSSAAQAAAGAD